MPPRDFMRALRSLGVANTKKPSSIQPIPLLKGGDGEILDTADKVRDCWRSYFQEQEDGTPSDLQTLLQEADVISDRQTHLPSWSDLPTLFQLEHFFRRTAKGKAFFGDGIPGDLLAMAPKQMAELLYSCICKEIAYVREPIAHKGGYLIPAFKKGDPSLPQNYRSLFVSSVVGKAIHAMYRQELAEVFHGCRLPFQIGGLKGHGITQAALVLQSFQRQAIRQKKSVCFFFLDVANAFYRLARQHIIQGTDDTRSPRQLFAAMNLPTEAAAEFEQMVAEPGAIDASEAPGFLKRLFREFYHQTWFCLRNDSAVIKTRRGSRPGDSFADLCFSSALTKIMEPIMQQFRTLYPDTGLVWDGVSSPVRRGPIAFELDFLMPIWADDLALALSDADPAVLVEKAKVIIGIILDGVVAAGLVPNLKHGKTELLIDIRGKGANSVKKTIYHTDYQLVVPSRYEDYSLRMVGAYKHLGTWLQSGAGIAKDLAVKFAAAHDLLTKYKGPVFGNKKMPLDKKRQLFEMMIMSTITFNAAVWCPRNKRQGEQLIASFMRLYKRLCVLHFGSEAIKWGRVRILNEFHLPDPEVTICRARLRQLLQRVQVGQPHTWALLQTDKHWQEVLNTDLLWLAEFCPEDEVPYPIEQCWEELAAFLLSSPGRWKKILKKAVARHIGTRKLDAEWNAWHSTITHEVLQAGFGHHIPQTQGDQHHYCLACRMVFARRSALAVHAFKKHGRINKVRVFVQGTRCEFCLKLYDRYTDLVNHVNHSSACFGFYRNRGQVVECQPGVNSKQENQNRKALRRPVLQTEGPPCPPVPELIDLARSEHEELKTCWEQASECFAGNADWLDQLRVATLKTTLFHEEILQCFASWWEDWCYRHQHCRLSELVVFGRFSSLASADWFLNKDSKERMCSDDAIRFFAQEAWTFQDVLWSPARSVRYFPRTVAHLFSGERRSGDVQSFLEAAGFASLSIDVVFDLEWGNLLRPDTLVLFQKALQERVLLGFLAGPPCETWSRARAVACANGPRVVRSRSRLQGLKCLTQKEMRQVAVGNQLLGVTLVLVWSAIVSGATAIVEHPAEPADQSLPAIWHLDVMTFFLRFACCQKIRIEQGRFGGLSPKPTDLLIVHGLADTGGFFVENRTTPLPRTTRIGRDSDGSWKTSVLKRYPPDLCRVFAALFDVCQPENELMETPPPWFTGAVEKLMAHFDSEATMGPDYCPGAWKG